MVVRGFADRPLVRAVLAADDRAVLVCSPENIAAIKAGTRNPPLVGFPREDVFVADPAVVASVAKGDVVKWGQLTPY